MKRSILAGLFLLIMLTTTMLSGFGGGIRTAAADEPTPTPTTPADPAGKGGGGNVGG